MRVLAALGACAVLTACIDDTRDSQSDEAVRPSSMEAAAFTNDDRDELSSLLSDVRLSSPKHLPSNPFEEHFFANGSWKGWFTHIDVMSYQGEWAISPHSDDDLRLCVEVKSMNGDTLKEVERICRRVLVDPARRIFISNLFTGGDPKLVEVNSNN